MKLQLRTFGSALLCLALLSCGEAKDDFDLLRGALQPDAPRFHPRANALASIRPIPSRLEVGFPTRDLSGVMLLETERDGVQTWLTADGATITLEEGFLTSVKGFGSGLAASDVRQSADLVLARQPGTAERLHSFLNGNDQIELRAYKCEVEPMGAETVFVLGQPVATQKLEERCHGVADSFTNTYWVGTKASGLVQSSQWTGSFLGNLFMKAVPDEI
ncbi:YjbF family lipoprotein [Leisingera daeponensis]|uniref:YjbF family lipoprotein n=1 Tax=Leisingera daeponensis TaxID=405746 RepID=UPI001C95B600|nr:YjbF family lipoprotein [Leisingera daeponensis]MBY6059432.1 YjbF family lipoprotein [Leisingera daeponensis]